MTELRFAGHQHTLAAVVAGLLIGFYDGALGPGTGSFFVFTLVGLLGYNFLEASAKARIANWATNLAALLVFVPQGAVMWKVGLVVGRVQPARRLRRGADGGVAGQPVRPGVLRRGGVGVHREDRLGRAGTCVTGIDSLAPMSEGPVKWVSAFLDTPVGDGSTAAAVFWTAVTGTMVADRRGASSASTCRWTP